MPLKGRNCEGSGYGRVTSYEALPLEQLKVCLK